MKCCSRLFVRSAPVGTPFRRAAGEFAAVEAVLRGEAVLGGELVAATSHLLVVLQVRAAAARILTIVNYPPHVDEPAAPAPVAALEPRVRFDGASRTVIDGPFAEAKELVAGFWLWQVKSKAEALEWLKRAPFVSSLIHPRNPVLVHSQFRLLDFVWPSSRQMYRVKLCSGFDLLTRLTRSHCREPKKPSIRFGLQTVASSGSLPAAS